MDSPAPQPSNPRSTTLDVDDEDSEEEFDSDYDEATIILENEYGDRVTHDTNLTRAMYCGGLARVKALLVRGYQVSVEDVYGALFAAITNQPGFKNTRVLGEVLRVGGSANGRLAEFHTPPTGSTGWQDRDIGVTFGNYVEGRYPLMLAAKRCERGQWESFRHSKAIRLLLKHGADPFAIYRQIVITPDLYPFPGQHKLSDPENPSSAPYWQASNVYGLRTIVHSAIEDGERISAFFDHDYRIDLEHRDPQGRTILHSVCRRRVGADALPEVSYWRPGIAPQTDSLFDIVRLRNADMLAVDNRGRNVVHHLLEAKAGRYMFAKIRNALQWTVDHHPELVQQPDHFGTFPIHLSIRRLAMYASWKRPRKKEPAAAPESAIYMLLDAGADPHVRDGKGNTVFHYLAATGLAENFGEPMRRVLRRFVELGVDVNVCNSAGYSAVSGWLAGWDRRLLSDPCSRPNGCYALLDRTGTDEIDSEILALFDQAGVEWTAKNSRGQTLLHILLKERSKRAPFRARYLLQKGVDPSLEDSNGNNVQNLVDTVDEWIENLSKMKEPQIQR